MKVLILATDIFTRGGIARYTSTLASTLGKMLGSENVDVLCFFDWGYEGQQPREFGLIAPVSGKARAGFWSRLRFMFNAARAGFQGYDLVIANHVALAPVAAIMKLVFGTPYWVACHCIEVWWGTSRWRQAALRNANLILPVSLYTADVVKQMKGINGTRVKVLYNAIPDSLAESLLTREATSSVNGAKSAELHHQADKILLSVCSLVEKNKFKGVDTVIRSLPTVLKAVPDLRYIVAGDGGLRRELENLAIETGVAKNVVFTGEISDAELSNLYRACDVFVLPSRGQSATGAEGGEGFGRVYVEAAMAGKPVVGSRSGGASEAVLHGKTGLLVNPESSDEVAEALLTILQDPQLSAQMGSAGQEWAFKTFSEDALAGSLRDLLRPYGFKNESLQQLVQVGGQP